MYTKNLQSGKKMHVLYSIQSIENGTNARTCENSDRMKDHTSAVKPKRRPSRWRKISQDIGTHCQSSPGMTEGTSHLTRTSSERPLQDSPASTNNTGSLWKSRPTPILQSKATFRDNSENKTRIFDADNETSWKTLFGHPVWSLPRWWTQPTCVAANETQKLLVPIE